MIVGYIRERDRLLRFRTKMETTIMIHPQATTRSANARFKRRMATIAARCAMGSWIVLAAMPVAVVVFSFA